MKSFIKYVLFIVILLIVGGVVYYFFIDNKITISFNTNIDTTLSNIEIRKGESINLPTLTKDGFHFLGWYIGDTKVDNNYKFDKTSVLTAKWDDNMMTITFDSKGGESIPSQTIKCGEEIKFPTPTKEGYHFVAWRDKNDVIISSETKLVCENINLYAEWEKNNTSNSNAWQSKVGAKPILYLYPEKKEKVKVSFEYPNLLTTTYPKYLDKWEVTAYPDGSLYYKNNQYYYGLYWEEKYDYDDDFQEGFYVEKDDALKFLEEKLDKIGLTRREANEFIMYWLPILEKNEKNLVYFELTEERESYNKLYIEPKPDSLLRMFIKIKKVDKKVNIKEQKLETFQRHGFTAVEWGGTNLK